MRIISIRRGFTSDHSSTSYEFLAVDRPLKREERQDVASLSSRANPTRRRVSFIYHVDGYDIPGGWEPLVRDYYDVMYSESYDWWTLALAFEASSEKQKELMEYEFYGIEDLGVSINTYENRVVVKIYCCLDFINVDDYYDEFEEYEDEEDFDEDYESEDPFLALLTQIRRQLVEGDYRVLYAVWEKYGCEEDELPVPCEKTEGSSIVKKFRSLLRVP